MSLLLIRRLPSLQFLTPTLVRFKSSSSKRWLQRQKDDVFTRQAKHDNMKSRAAFKLLQIDERFRIFHSSDETPMNVVDLGAAPGAWNQVALERCPKKSRILGVDILPYKPPMGVSSMQANILSKRTHERIREFYAQREEDEGSRRRDVEIVTGTGETITVQESPLIENSLASVENPFLYPLDVVLSDMYVPFIQVSGFASATTNRPYFRMANTSGLAVRDHQMSMDLCDAALIVAIDLLKKSGSLVMKFFSGDKDRFLEKRLKKVFGKVVRYKPEASRRESKEYYFVCLNKKADHVDKVEVFRAA